jgi:hypothetical protein
LRPNPADPSELGRMSVGWSRSSALERLGLEEDGQGGGESVQEGFAAEGADLAAAEEAGEGLRAE